MPSWDVARDERIRNSRYSASRVIRAHSESVWSGEVSPRTNDELIAGRHLPVAFRSSAEPVAIPLVEARASNASPIDAFTASSAAVLQFLPRDVAGVVLLAVARSALDHSSALRPTKTSTAANFLPTTGSRYLTARRASHCNKILFTSWSFVMRGRLRTLNTPVEDASHNH